MFLVFGCPIELKGTNFQPFDFTKHVWLSLLAQITLMKITLGVKQLLADWFARKNLRRHGSINNVYIG